MDIRFSGYGENILTFECTDNVMPSNLVKMIASGKVTNASENDDFIGMCIGTNGRYAAIQLDGYIETFKTGTVNVGYNKLVKASKGVKTAENGIDRLVIYSDDTKIGFIL